MEKIVMGGVNNFAPSIREVPDFLAKGHTNMINVSKKFETCFREVIKEVGFNNMRDSELLKLTIRNKLEDLTREKNLLLILVDEGKINKILEELKGNGSVPFGKIQQIKNYMITRYGIDSNFILMLINSICRVMESNFNLPKGKRACEQLKQMRAKFAEANGIDYEEEECTNQEPCNGICPYCEMKNKELLEKAHLLAREKELCFPQIKIEPIKNEMRDDAET